MSRPNAIFARFRIAALAATAAVALAGCNAETTDTARRASKPLSPQMLSLMSGKDMAPSSPMVVRIYKEEAELEVWKVKGDGNYALLKTYPICRWSGQLGPKVRMGDRQAPEGFYTITPGQMNPNSNYYLSFNLGFPNAFDKAYGRTGEFLMVHGDCSSAGCYAMTDEQISEIFSLARESFAGGQRAFQVQAYPFRMTPKNLARHRDNPNMAFWRNLKEGSDHFEVTGQEPKVNVCERRYVFDAQAPAGAAFNPAGPCPSYQVPAEIAQAVGAKERADDAQMASLAPASPTVPVRTSVDGGMHPVFLAKFTGPQASGDRIAFAAEPPGTIPAHAVPPRVADGTLVSSPTEVVPPRSATAAPGAVAEAPAVAEPAPVPGAMPPAPRLAPTAARPASAPQPPAHSAAAPAAKPAHVVVANIAPAPKPGAAKATDGKTVDGKAADGRAGDTKSAARALPNTSDFAFVPAPSMTGASPIVTTGGFTR